MRVLPKAIFLSIIFSIILIIIKIFLKTNETNLLKDKKTEDYFKRVVNWSEYQIKSEGEVNRILVLGEGRSGTSFIADLLQQSWPTFYIFEPLHYLTVGKGRSDPSIGRQAIDMMSKLFECDFESIKNLEPIFWDYVYLIRHIPLNKYPGLNKGNLYDKIINKYVCQRCDNVLIKSIRLNFDEFIEIQNNLGKQIKLLYVMRDPRALFSSRCSKSLDWCHYDDVVEICQGIKNDIVLLNEYAHSKALGQVYLVRYEDLAIEPERTAQALYKTLALDFHPRISQWVRNHTNNFDQLGDDYSTVRPSKWTAFKWIKNLNLVRVMEIQDKCRQIMDLMGYKLFEQEQFDQIKKLFIEHKLIENVTTVLNPDYPLNHLAIKYLN